MKRFLEMIEEVKRKGIVYLDDNRSGASPRKVDTAHFFKMVEECQPMVYMVPKEGTKEAPDIVNEQGETIYAKLDAPFKVFSIEMLGGDVTTPAPTDPVMGAMRTIERSILGGHSKDGRMVWTYCILAYEFAPKEFGYYAYGAIEEDSGEKLSFVYWTRTLDKIVEAFVDRLNAEAVGTENVRQRIKVGRGENKKHITFRRVVHVRPKKFQTFHAPSGKPIDWSHRWMVRGHWRKHDGVGKDRAGVYCVEGHTWVTEYEKGPETAPLIKKTRLVSE